MLPGFRFLFAAIALSVSILIFGLGAAALLRAAHEQFASNPTWRTAPEPRFAQKSEPPPPVLAVLQLETQPSVQKPADPQPVDVPASPPAPESTASPPPAEPEAVVSPAPEGEKVAALATQDVSPLAEAAKTDVQPAEVPVASDAAPVPTEEIKVAAAGEAKPQTNDAAPATPQTSKAEPAETQAVEPAKPEAAIALSMPAADSIAIKVAALGGPPAENENAAPKKDTSEKAERNVEKARLRAQARARARRRLAARARLVRQQQAAAQQQQLGLFGQQGPMPARSP